jgi:hypothetical protein
MFRGLHSILIFSALPPFLILSPKNYMGVFSNVCICTPGGGGGAGQMKDCVGGGGAGDASIGGH